MSSALLGKQKFKVIVCTLRSQHFQLWTKCLKKNQIAAGNYTIQEQHKWNSSYTGLFNKTSCLNLKPDLWKYGKTESLSTKDESNLTIADEEEPIINKFNLKLLLYNGNDDIMKKLNSSEGICEVKRVLETEKSDLNKEHIVQSIILLWIFNRQNTLSGRPNKEDERDFIAYILPQLKANISKLNIMELSTCYLYLRKMGVENTNSVLQHLLMNALDDIERAESAVELPALSRLVVGINIGRNFFTPMLCANFMRHLEHHIDFFKNEEDARMIAICLYNLQIIINSELMELYKEKVSGLIASGEISSATPKTIIKILNLLNMPVWSHEHVPLIRKLLLTIEKCLKELDEDELKIIFRIYQFHQEPASLHEPLGQALEEMLSKKITPDTLACFMPFARPQGTETLINAFKALINSPDSYDFHSSSGYLFYTLRALKISDKKICDAYWNSVMRDMEAIPEEVTQLRFVRHCHRYMNFNNNLGGTYRHMALEKKLCQICMNAVEHDLAGRIPQQFARLASFVLAYGHTPYSWKKYPNIVLSKIVTMGEQFTPTDWFLISRGLQTSLEMRYRYEVPQLARMQISTINSVLSACIERYLDSDELTPTDLNMLVRAVSKRKGLKNSVIYHKTLQKYKDIQCNDLNSRIIKDIAYNFTATNYLVPEILDKIFTYIENNHEHIGGETLEKVLTCTYNLGYTPSSYDALHIAGIILLRDFNYMSGLSLVQACLALCFYKTVPEELISKVFCVKFIQRVEEEIQICYSKATYPERVLNTVMQMNRSICLDFPEANVPWFQQNFIEAQISKMTPNETDFSSDVKNMLTALLKNKSYIRCNHTTPYGYQIDFVINFDKNQKPIDTPVETTMLDRITKVAILLLKLDSFCANDLNALKGPESLKIKHLEMMGYKVLHINEHDWNSKYMNVPGAKQNYLKYLLQISI